MTPTELAAAFCALPEAQQTEFFLEVARRDHIARRTLEFVYLASVSGDLDQEITP